MFNSISKLFVNNDKRIIDDLACKIQNQIHNLHLKEPNNEIFDQEGILNGYSIVKEYIDEGEYAIAIEHLLYMVYESDISYSTGIIEELNKLVSKYKF